MGDNISNRITINEAILCGKPVVRGMRISVEHILKKLSKGISTKAIIEDYPMLEKKDIEACIAFTPNLLKNTIHQPAH